MRVLHVASEATPFAKTGGLADVAGALPEALAHQGCDVTLVIPAYREVFSKGLRSSPPAWPSTCRSACGTCTPGFFAA